MIRFRTGQCGDLLNALRNESAFAPAFSRTVAPTAERTVGPARNVVESLTSKPGIREQHRSKPVKLRLRKCFPACPRKRIWLRALYEYSSREGAPPYLCCAVRRENRRPDNREASPRRRGRSRAAALRALPHCFCQKQRFSEMVRIDALAASVRLAYCMTSRSTRVASCCSRWRNACRSALSS
jgi:hypothetical protein